MGGRNIRKLIIYTVPFIGKNCAMPGALKRTPSSSLESVLAKHLISSDGTKSVLIGPELVTYLLSNCCQNDDEGSKSRVSMRFISTPAILSFNASQDLFFNDPLLVFIVLIVFHQLQIAPGAFVRCYSQIAILSGTKDNGVFPNIHDYFNTHIECLPSPGYKDGFFYQLVESAKDAGERPTAAFPSSHVGISVICMLLAWHSKNKLLFYVLLPLFIFLCFSTVYIQAHYAIDAIAGLITGVAFYFFFKQKNFIKTN